MKRIATLVVGAPDREAQVAASLAQRAGLEVLYATHQGARVEARNAYEADGVSVQTAEVLLFECRPKFIHPTVSVRHLDHHFPGDPGYGKPPAEFLPASSLGQLISWLAQNKAILPHDKELGLSITGDTPEPDDQDGDLYWVQDTLTDDWFVVEGSFVYLIPEEIALTAAADHCLAAAYQGQCPGVDPDRLLKWRVRTRAAFQGRSVEDVEADVQAARRSLAEAPRINLGNIPVADLRPIGTVPEAPEAAARDGVPFLARLKDGKIVLQAAPPEAIQALLDGALALADCYGDPARGFAGGYEA